MLFDSHCHLTDKKFTDNIKNVLDNASRAGVSKLITSGTSLEDSKKACEIAEAHKNVYCTAGIYPHEDLDLAPEEALKSLQKIIDSSEKVVGVGECGIDVPETPPEYKVRPQEDQLKFFEVQVLLALENNLPLVIHNRNGDRKILETLKKHRSNWLSGMAHCFVSSWETAQEFLDLGFYISFSGIITYNSGISILETVEKTPLDRILLETDSPFLSPQGRRGETNEPKYVKIIAEKVAAVRNSPIVKVQEQTYANARRLFKI